MKKRFLAMVLIVMVVITGVASASEPSDWAKNEIIDVFPSMFSTLGIELNYQRDITRAEFSMFAFNVYSALKGPISTDAVENKFSDIGAEPVDIFIPMVNSIGIVNGISETEFAPKKGLSRQELCVMIVRAIEKSNPDKATEIDAAAGSTASFADSAQIADWAKRSVDYSVKSGIIKGISESSVAPTGNVSVEQAMVICSRIVKSAVGQ